MPHRSRTDNFRAGLVMLAAMAGFAIEDAMIKSAAAEVPMGQIMMIVGLVGCLAYGTLARLRGQRLWTRGLGAPAMLLRSAAEIAATACGMTALALLPMSLATAIAQTAPVVTALGAALFLREQVPPLRVLAILLGMGGVILILDPGPGIPDPAVLIAFAGVLALALRDLATRAAPPALSLPQLCFLGSAITTLAGLAMLEVERARPVLPPLHAGLTIAGAATLGTVVYYALTYALRRGEASAVVPFRYTRLVFALILGAVVFGERPSLQTLAGMALVTGAGLTMLWCGRIARRGAIRPSPAVAPSL